MLDGAHKHAIMRGSNSSLPSGVSCSLKGLGQEGGACWEGRGVALMTEAAKRAAECHTQLLVCRY